MQIIQDHHHGALIGQSRQKVSYSQEDLLAELPAILRAGVTELQVAAWLHQRMRHQGLDSAWDWDADPIVSFGPQAEVGHSLPTQRALQPGQLVHVDFGVKQDGFCSELQRMWYLPAAGETRLPAPVAQAWQAVRRALLAGADALRPGAQGWQVDTFWTRFCRSRIYQAVPRYGCSRQERQVFTYKRRTVYAINYS